MLTISRQDKGSQDSVMEADVDVTASHVGLDEPKRSTPSCNGCAVYALAKLGVLEAWDEPEMEGDTMG